MNPNITIEELENRLKIRNVNNEYKYDLSNFKKMSSKIIIKCKNGHVFEQRISDHLVGHGCKKCSISKRIPNLNKIKKRLNFDKFEYPKLETEYYNSRSTITIVCKKCEYKFTQTVNNHLNKNQGCPKCANNIKLTEEEILKRLNERNFDKKYTYPYPLEEYRNHLSKITIICDCGNHFKQSFKKHINGQGCPICKKSSYNESLIENILIDKKIKHIKQHKFKDCKNIFQLPFDFYLPDYNICIEYDGRQHYQPIYEWGGESYLCKIKQNDEIKTNYCQNNDIKLYRISYKDKTIEKLNQILNFLHI